MGNSIVRGQPWSIRLRLKPEQIVVGNIQGIYLAVVQGANKTVKIFADGVSNWTLNSSQNTVTCQLSAANTNTLTAGIRAGISAHITDTSGVKSEVFAGIYAVENSGSTYVLPDILDANIQSGQTIPDSEVDADLRPVTFTSNGTYTPSGFDGYSKVTVNVGAPSGTKQITITENGTVTENVANYANAAITTNVVNQDYLASLTALGVTEDLADSIGALTTYANGVTGESDTTLSDAVESLADGYGQGGGSADNTLEYAYANNGTIASLIWHGSGKIVNGNFNSFFGGFNRNIPITFPDKPTQVDTSAFYNCRLRINWTDMTEVVATGSGAFRLLYSTDCSSDVVRMPKLDGLTHDGLTSQSAFMYMSAKAPSTYYFDTIQNIPREMFTNCGIPNLSATFGSIGHAVQSAGLYPFRNPQSTAGGTVTIYTTGEYLDTLRTAVEAGNTAFTFVYKASEATTYNGTSYSAGDTITV